MSARVSCNCRRGFECTRQSCNYDDVNVHDAEVRHPVEMSGDLLVECREKFENRTGLRVGWMLIDASKVILVIEIMNKSDITVLVGKGTVIRLVMIMKLNLTFESIMGH